LAAAFQVGYECISLSFHPFGSALAAGSSEGHLIVVNAETGSTMLTLRVCGSPLNCLEYNQIGDMVAIGSQNGNSCAEVEMSKIFKFLHLFPPRQDPFICSESLAMASRTRESTRFEALSR
jgi:WD40 repeat protein